MKISLFLFVLFLNMANNNLIAQDNLIPNCNFEKTSYCINNYSDFDALLDWDKPTSGTTDFFNSCNKSIFGIPNNFAGYQKSGTGNSYVGLFLYNKEIDNYFTYREYIQAKLKYSLDSCYQYKITLAVNLSNCSGYAVKNIAICLSEEPVKSVKSILFTKNLTCNELLLKFDSKVIIDTIGWKKLNITFTPTGKERYITIGNFMDNDSTQVVKVRTNGSKQCSKELKKVAYYYIDYVILFKE
ncbi:MAG: hypothetical protein GXO89_07210 [Chlorobi bacterium]|nr:hypothetical protein [Chlorobiota bacterium]